MASLPDDGKGTGALTIIREAIPPDIGRQIIVLSPTPMVREPVPEPETWGTFLNNNLVPFS
jgi:hypothetical protein